MTKNPIVEMLNEYPRHFEIVGRAYPDLEEILRYVQNDMYRVLFKVYFVKTGS